MLAKKTRSRQGPAPCFASAHTLTPRFAKSPKFASRGIFASKAQRSLPVSGSSATTLPYGVPM